MTAEGSAVPSPPATVADIYYCYRLLLGREPDTGGLRTYTSLIGGAPTPVDDLVARFTASAEFNDRLGTTLGWTRDRQPQRVELDGFAMYVHEDDLGVGGAIAADRSYEPHVSRALRTALSPGATFVDVGASIGYFSCLAGITVGPTGRVFAFEPGPQNLELLLFNLAVNAIACARVYPLALSERDQVLSYYAEGGNGCARPFDGDAAALGRAALIQACALDEVLPPGARVDVMKMDAEGGEGAALLGARRCIEANRPVVTLEFAPDMLPLASGMTGLDLLQLVRDLGYEIDVIGPDEWQPTPRTDSEVMEALDRSVGGHVDLFTWPR